MILNFSEIVDFQDNGCQQIPFNERSKPSLTRYDRNRLLVELHYVYCIHKFKAFQLIVGQFSQACSRFSSFTRSFAAGVLFEQWGIMRTKLSKLKTVILWPAFWNYDFWNLRMLTIPEIWSHIAPYYWRNISKIFHWNLAILQKYL